MEFIQSILSLDWASIGVHALAIFGGLKGLAAITPWTVDDKLITWIEQTLKKVGILK